MGLTWFLMPDARLPTRDLLVTCSGGNAPGAALGVERLCVRIGFGAVYSPGMEDGMEWWGGWMDDRTKRSEAGRMIETIACEVLAIGPEKIQIKTRAKKRGELTQTRAEQGELHHCRTRQGREKEGQNRPSIILGSGTVSHIFLHHHRF